jgi:hypothetical protein
LSWKPGAGVAAPTGEIFRARPGLSTELSRNLRQSENFLPDFRRKLLISLKTGATFPPFFALFPPFFAPFPLKKGDKMRI